MIVGYVHFGGAMGDGVRVTAIRRFFDEEEIAHREFVLTHIRKPVDISRETLSLAGLRHVARKLFVDRAHPLLKEINWHVEVRQWEESVQAAVKQLLGQASQVDVLHAELVFAGLACARVKSLCGKPYVYDMHGLIGEEAKLTGSHEYSQACRRWEREVVTGADRIIVVTEAIREYVRETYGVPSERIVLCPNGSYVNGIEARFRNPIRVLYAGNFAPYENVMSFVRTAELVAGKEVRFVLMGDGAQRNEIFDYINSRSVDVVYLGKKKYEQVFPIFAAMQVGFFGQVGGTAMTGSPIKVLDYAACGLPVIAGPGAWADPIRRYNCGVIVDDASPEQFAGAIKQFTDEEAWVTMSRSAKRMVNDLFQWKDVLRPLKNLYGTELS